MVGFSNLKYTVNKQDQKSTRCDISKPNTAKPDAAMPDTAVPDSAKPNIAKPDTGYWSNMNFTMFCNDDS